MSLEFVFSRCFSVFDKERMTFHFALFWPKQQNKYIPELGCFDPNIVLFCNRWGGWGVVGGGANQFYLNYALLVVVEVVVVVEEVVEVVQTNYI